MNATALSQLVKFKVMACAWLCIIFGAVWTVCYLVGGLLPDLISNMPVFDPAIGKLISDVLKALTPILAIMVFIPINAMFMVLLERRALALFTVRLGPNRVGPDGFGQTAADAVKLLFKEDITPIGADAFMFTMAPIIFFAPSIIGAVPLLAAITGNQPLFQIVNIPTGIFYVLAVSAIPVVGIVMGGWASNNKYSLVGGLRSAAQAISYEIPLVLSVITVCMFAGSLDVVQIANQQHGNWGFLNWNIFGGGSLLTPASQLGQSLGLTQLSHLICDNIRFFPIEATMIIISKVSAFLLTICMISLFGIYLTGACAEINRIPFDLPEAESELVSGYNTEYSGIKFAIFFLAEFTNLFIVSSIATVLFLGGGASPIAGFLDGYNVLPGINLEGMQFPPFFNPVTFFQIFWVIVKVYSLVFFAILIRGTLPRFRIDQLLDFGWKRLIPISIGLLIAVTFLKELV